MPAITDEITLTNWNIGGAKYLETPLKMDNKHDPDKMSREEFGDKLNQALYHLLIGKPHIVTMQEVTWFDERGDFENPKCVIEEATVKDYEFTTLTTKLIDTRRHSHQGKWNKIAIQGGWEGEPFLAQGNAMLVHKDVKSQMFPIMSLPKSNVLYSQWLASKEGSRKEIPIQEHIANKLFVEDVALYTGMYFGNRDTEPRAASVIHFVVPGKKGNPQDIFVLNCHLTTITNEREGIPRVDKAASSKRLIQLDTIMDGIISPYHLWRKSSYKLRNEPIELTNLETIERNSPIWLLAGDFNFTPESQEYRSIKSQNFVDLMENHNMGTKAKGMGKDPSLTLDYVFAGPLFESIDPTKLQRAQNRVNTDRMVRASDHYPLVTSLSFDALT